MRYTAVLLHGIFDTGNVFSTLAERLCEHGFRTIAPDLAPNDGSVSIATLAAQVSALIEREIEPTEWLTLIGFSMGGIVARYYLQELGGCERAKRLITISSPHNGSMLANVAVGEGAKELRQNSDLLRRLNAREEMLLPLAPLSLWTPLDLMIVPARSSVWRIATNVSFNVVAHPLMLRSKAVHRTILQSLLESKNEQSVKENRSAQ